MTKEETKAPEQKQKLTYDQLASYAGQLEARLKQAMGNIQGLQEQLQMYQMQDYYQRTQLLCMITANEKIDGEFRSQCEAELKELVFPPKKEEEAK